MRLDEKARIFNFPNSPNSPNSPKLANFHPFPTILFSPPPLPTPPLPGSESESARSEAPGSLYIQDGTWEAEKAGWKAAEAAV